MWRPRCNMHRRRLRTKEAPPKFDGAQEYLFFCQYLTQHAPTLRVGGPAAVGRRASGVVPALEARATELPPTGDLTPNRFAWRRLDAGVSGRKAPRQFIAHLTRDKLTRKDTALISSTLADNDCFQTMARRATRESCRGATCAIRHWPVCDFLQIADDPTAHSQAQNHVRAAFGPNFRPLYSLPFLEAQQPPAQGETAQHRSSIRHPTRKANRCFSDSYASSFQQAV